MEELQNNTLPEYSKEALLYGKRVFQQECTFITGAADENGIPDTRLTEIAFAGRSNVGKSSLLNALTERKSLARISSNPGRTQQINFFQLGESLILADLPGYGYAKAPKNSVKKWTQLIRAYLQGRQPLRRVCLLIDARHGIKKNDTEIFSLLDQAAMSYQIILTKCDKISKRQQQKILLETAEKLKKHVAAHPLVIPASAHKKEGLEIIRSTLAQLLIH